MILMIKEINMSNEEIPKPNAKIKRDEGSYYQVFSNEEYLYIVEESASHSKIVKMCRTKDTACDDDNDYDYIYVLPKIVTKDKFKNLKDGDYEIERGCFEYKDIMGKYNDGKVSLVVTSDLDLKLNWYFEGVKPLNDNSKQINEVKLILPKNKSLFKITRNYNDQCNSAQRNEWWLLIADENFCEKHKVDEFGEKINAIKLNEVKYGNVKISVDREMIFNYGSICLTRKNSFHKLSDDDKQM